jgi:hypothetical protein
MVGVISSHVVDLKAQWTPNQVGGTFSSIAQVYLKGPQSRTIFRLIALAIVV